MLKNKEENENQPSKEAIKLRKLAETTSFYTFSLYPYTFWVPAFIIFFIGAFFLYFIMVKLRKEE